MSYTRKEYLFVWGSLVGAGAPRPSNKGQRHRMNTAVRQLLQAGVTPEAIKQKAQELRS